MQEDLSDFVLSDTWNALMTVIEQYTANIEANVMKYHLSKGADGLAYEKARAEGARQLQTAIISLKRTLKPKG